jgi:alcohol dehydrogenase
MLRE